MERFSGWFSQVGGRGPRPFALCRWFRSTSAEQRPTNRRSNSFHAPFRARIHHRVDHFQISNRTSVKRIAHRSYWRRMDRRYNFQRRQVYTARDGLFRHRHQTIGRKWRHRRCGFTSFAVGLQHRRDVTSHDVNEIAIVKFRNIPVFNVTCNSMLLLLLLLWDRFIILIIFAVVVIAGRRRIQPYTTVNTTLGLRLASVNGYYISEQCFVVRRFGHRVQAAHNYLIQMAPFQQCHVTAQHAFDQRPSLQFHILSNAKPIAQVVQPDAYQIYCSASASPRQRIGFSPDWLVRDRLFRHVDCANFDHVLRRRRAASGSGQGRIETNTRRTVHFQTPANGSTVPGESELLHRSVIVHDAGTFGRNFHTGRHTALARLGPQRRRLFPDQLFQNSLFNDVQVLYTVSAEFLFILDHHLYYFVKMKRRLVDDVLHCPWKQIATTISKQHQLDADRIDSVLCGQFLSANVEKDHRRSVDVAQQRPTNVPNRPHPC
ncbi:hypothetical protein Tsp_01898 [Trichinella spiralis]|uniref:hypothetical protein n=1 Tax=Trichinella spiralis TaxID=6334 RepID=UPI0001EFB4E8|nr:hypothetical protein Tsp_01898 [Trichinella spiralis]